MKIDEGCIVTVSTGFEEREFVVVRVVGDKTEMQTDCAFSCDYSRIDVITLVPKRLAGAFNEV